MQSQSSNSIQRELGIGEVVAQTFSLFRRNYFHYLTIFLVFEAIIGIFTAVINYYVILPTLSPLTTQQFFNSLLSFYAATFLRLALAELVSLVFATLATAVAVKICSEVIENRPPSLTGALRVTFSRLLSLWGVSIVTGIIIALGLIAVIVPGIIFAIMYSLVIPALLIERVGVTASMTRSRQLVSQRWGKTFLLFLVIAIIMLVPGLIVTAITSLVGNAPLHDFLDSLISAFYAPIMPISLTLYYYSNRARLNTPPPSYYPYGPPQPYSQQGPAIAPPPQGTQAAYCMHCGHRIMSPGPFCPNCGGKLS